MRRHSARTQPPRAPVRRVESIHPHARAAGRCVHELGPGWIDDDPHVRGTGTGRLEEYEVAGLHFVK